MDRGLPVIVGVNKDGKVARNDSGKKINEGITGHFLVLVGYQEELKNGKWAVTELYGIDNATGNSWRDRMKLGQPSPYNQMAGSISNDRLLLLLLEGILGYSLCRTL